MEHTENNRKRITSSRAEGEGDDHYTLQSLGQIGHSVHQKRPKMSSNTQRSNYINIITEQKLTEF